MLEAAQKQPRRRRRLPLGVAVTAAVVLAALPVVYAAPVPYLHQGGNCYQFSLSPYPLDDLIIGGSQSATWCQERMAGFCFYGVKNNYCYGGNEFNVDPLLPAAANDCGIACLCDGGCNADDTRPCGGANAISLYQNDNLPGCAPPPTAYSSSASVVVPVGFSSSAAALAPTGPTMFLDGLEPQPQQNCYLYRNLTTSRYLLDNNNGGSYQGSTDNTAAWCQNAMASFCYYGMQNNYCFGRNVFSGAVVPTRGACTTPCPGCTQAEGCEACGSATSNAISVYTNANAPGCVFASSTVVAQAPAAYSSSASSVVAPVGFSSSSSSSAAAPPIVQFLDGREPLAQQQNCYRNQDPDPLSGYPYMLGGGAFSSSADSNSASWCQREMRCFRYYGVHVNHCYGRNDFNAVLPLPHTRDACTSDCTACAGQIDCEKCGGGNSVSVYVNDNIPTSCAMSSSALTATAPDPYSSSLLPTNPAAAFSSSMVPTVLMVASSSSIAGTTAAQVITPYADQAGNNCYRHVDTETGQYLLYVPGGPASEWLNAADTNSHESCQRAMACFRYYGVRANFCYGRHALNGAEEATPGECTASCAAAPGEKCGGANAISVFVNENPPPCPYSSSLMPPLAFSSSSVVSSSVAAPASSSNTPLAPIASSSAGAVVVPPAFSSSAATLSVPGISSSSSSNTAAANVPVYVSSSSSSAASSSVLFSSSALPPPVATTAATPSTAAPSTAMSVNATTAAPTATTTTTTTTTIGPTTAVAAATSAYNTWTDTESTSSNLFYLVCGVGGAALLVLLIVVIWACTSKIPALQASIQANSAHAAEGATATGEGRTNSRNKAKKAAASKTYRSNNTDDGSRAVSGIRAAFQRPTATTAYAPLQLHGQAHPQPSDDMDLFI